MKRKETELVLDALCSEAVQRWVEGTAVPVEIFVNWVRSRKVFWVFEGENETGEVGDAECSSRS